MRTTSTSMLLAGLVCLLPFAWTAGALGADDSAVNAEAARLTEAEALAEIDLLRRGLARIHPGYDRYATAEELATAWRRLEEEAVLGAEPGEWYREVSRLLAVLRCEHTRAELPLSIEQARQRGPAFLPFRFRLFGDRMFVDRAASGTKLERGAEVLTLDGRPVAEVLSVLRPFVPVDGWGDELRNASLEVDGDFLGSTFEQFYSLLFGDRPAVQLTLAGNAEPLELDKLPFEEWLALAGQGARRYLNLQDAVTAREIDEETALLRVDTFVNYRTPVDPFTLLAPPLRRWNEEGKRRLIVDLRSNGGGSTDAMFALIRLLTREPFELSSKAILVSPDPGEDLVPHLSSWEQQAVRPAPEALIDLGDGRFQVRPGLMGLGRRTVEPHPDHFRGEVLLLTSRFNGSGSTILHQLAKDHGFATLVGEATGGNVSGTTAGFILSLKLPESGIVVRIPRLFQPIEMKNPDRFQADRGVVPDVPVELTIEGFLAERDEILEAAKRLGIGSAATRPHP